MDERTFQDATTGDERFCDCAHVDCGTTESVESSRGILDAILQNTIGHLCWCRQADTLSADENRKVQGIRKNNIPGRKTDIMKWGRQ